jgi:hypothetical protein
MADLEGDKVNHGVIQGKPMGDIHLEMDKVNRGVIPSSLIVGSGMKAGLNQMPVHVPDGNHEPFLPVFEMQRRNGWDSHNCVQCAFTNSLETTASFFGKTINLSDRFLYWASGCTVDGNTLENCYLGFKRNASPPEESWPWPEGLSGGNEKESRRIYGIEPPVSVKIEAQRFFNDWDLRTPVYVGNSITAMKEALQRGPLWFSNFYHCMMIYRIDTRIRVFDTYLDEGGGKGSYPLSYAPELDAVYLVPFTPKVVPMPTTKLMIPQFARVTVVFPNGLKRFFFKDGKMMYDGNASNEVTEAWFDNNVNPVTHVFSSAPALTITQDQFEQFEVVGMDGKPYTYAFK